jgi:hypothetical protein
MRFLRACVNFSRLGAGMTILTFLGNLLAILPKKETGLSLFQVSVVRVFDVQRQHLVSPGMSAPTLRAWLLCHRNVHGSVIGPFRQRSRQLPGRKLTTHNLCTALWCASKAVSLVEEDSTQRVCRLIWKLTSGLDEQSDGPEPRDKGRLGRLSDPAACNASEA